MANLPIPTFISVEKVYFSYNEMTDERMIRIVAHDPMAGHKKRYSVIELDCNSGQTTCIGRELPRKFAKKIAKRGLRKVGKIGPIMYYAPKNR